MTSRRRIVRIGVLQAGKVQAAINALLTLFCGPFVVIASVEHIDKPKKVAAAVGIALAVPILGFVQGMLSATIYNLGAGWVGGIEVTVTEANDVVSAKQGTKA